MNPYLALPPGTYIWLPPLLDQVDRAQVVRVSLGGRVAVVANWYPPPHVPRTADGVGKWRRDNPEKAEEVGAAAAKGAPSGRSSWSACPYIPRSVWRRATATLYAVTCTAWPLCALAECAAASVTPARTACCTSTGSEPLLGPPRNAPAKDSFLDVFNNRKRTMQVWFGGFSRLSNWTSASNPPQEELDDKGNRERKRTSTAAV